MQLLFYLFYSIAAKFIINRNPAKFQGEWAENQQRMESSLKRLPELTDTEKERDYAKKYDEHFRKYFYLIGNDRNLAYATASKQLSGQSIQLSDIIARFKLKDEVSGKDFTKF
jgi:hypothetical protein